MATGKDFNDWVAEEIIKNIKSLDFVKKCFIVSRLYIENIFDYYIVDWNALRLLFLMNVSDNYDPIEIDKKLITQKIKNEFTIETQMQLQ